MNSNYTKRTKENLKKKEIEETKSDIYILEVQVYLRINGNYS